MHIIVNRLYLPRLNRSKVSSCLFHASFPWNKCKDLILEEIRIYSLEYRNGQKIYWDSLEKTRVVLPADRIKGIVLPSRGKTFHNMDISHAFSSPFGSDPLSICAKGSERIVLIVSDATRMVPTSDILPYVMDELISAGKKPGQVTAIVATGVHRPATEEEMRQILGKWWGIIRIENHDPYNDERLVFIRKTALGTPVIVNRTVFESDFRITIGKVEPHEFAGFSGGRKAVLPGISSESTIRINHSPDMILHPKAKPGSLDGNPVHNDMLEAERSLGVDFSINILVEPDNRLSGVFCGHPEKSHQAAVDAWFENSRTVFSSRPEIVVTTPGSPLNMNLYQSLKPVVSLAPVMSPEGIIVLYSKCIEGIGSSDMPTPFEKTSGPEEVIANLRMNYRIQMDHSLLLAKIVAQGIKIFLVSPHINPEITKSMLMTPFGTVQEALDTAWKLKGTNAKILFFPCSQRFLPTLEGDANGS